MKSKRCSHYLHSIIEAIVGGFVNCTSISFVPFKKDLNIKNENVHDLKCSRKQPLSELKISQSIKLIVKDGVIMIESEMNTKTISH